MATYVKKPLEIEAFRWTGDDEQDSEPKWIVEEIARGEISFRYAGTSECEMVIRTLEGDMTAKPGDYIIRGIEGELYPCKASVFEASYDPVDTGWKRSDGTALEPWQQRVMNEMHDLHIRRKRLADFLEDRLAPVSGEDRGFLNLQLHVMTSLEAVLAMRVGRFKHWPEDPQTPAA